MQITEKEINQAFDQSGDEILNHFKTPFKLIRYLSAAAEGIYFMEEKFKKHAREADDLRGTNYFILDTLREISEYWIENNSAGITEALKLIVHAWGSDEIYYSFLKGLSGMLWEMTEHGPTADQVLKHLESTQVFFNIAKRIKPIEEDWGALLVLQAKKHVAR